MHNIERRDRRAQGRGEEKQQKTHKFGLGGNEREEKNLWGLHFTHEFYLLGGKDISRFYLTLQNSPKYPFYDFPKLRILLRFEFNLLFYHY